MPTRARSIKRLLIVAAFLILLTAAPPDIRSDRLEG